MYNYPSMPGQVSQAMYPQTTSWMNQQANMPRYQNQSGAAPYSAQPVQMPQSYGYSAAPQPQNDIHWVQGAAGAKAYNLDPGRSVLLMDSEANKFYIKSTDQSGMPLPLRSFRYTEEAEEVDNNQSGNGKCDMSQYLTKDDFKRMLEEYLGPVGKDGSSK